MRKNVKKSHKEQKRGKRQRYIEAIDPLRKMLSCTAKEVGPAVQKVYRDNENFRNNYVPRVLVNY
jgi:hypothetical protein